MENEAISLAWKTPTMPAPAFAVYHLDCFKDYQHIPHRHPVGYTETPTRVPVQDFVPGSRCVGCGGTIGKTRGKEKTS